jgi:hypothetical protein
MNLPSNASFYSTRGATVHTLQCSSDDGFLSPSGEVGAQRRVRDRKSKMSGIPVSLYIFRAPVISLPLTLLLVELDDQACIDVKEVNKI